MENTFAIREHIIAYLDGIAKRLKQKIDPKFLSNVYLHGSLINNGGKSFSERQSDIDLLITTPLKTANDRVDFLIQLRALIFDLEEKLKKFLPDRDFLPITSICVATKYELEEGIHMSRNTRNAFGLVAFYPLGSDKPKFERVGESLQDDMVQFLLLPGWTIMADIQNSRSAFVTSDLSTSENSIPNDNKLYSLTSKQLLRSAYLVYCLENRIDPAMTEEDDVQIGYDELKKMLEKDSNDDHRANEILELIKSTSLTEGSLLKFGKLEHFLYLPELISVNTEREIRAYRTLLKDKVFKLGADIAIQELLRFKVTTLQVVDMAIVLYQNNDLLQDGYLEIEERRHEEMPLYNFSILNKGNLTRIASEWPDEVYNYIRNNYLGSKFVPEEYDSQCKVGFSGIHYTSPQKNSTTTKAKHPALVVRPLTYWLTQHFNKDIAAQQGNWELRNLRDKFSKELFTSTENFKCDCPSSLYLEMAIVTSDNKIPKFSKDTKYSVFGKRVGEPVHTCGIEYGFVWKDHIKKSTDNTIRLNVKKALWDGLLDELLIDHSLIKRWYVHTLAIQHTHLNAALVGVVYLKIDSDELKKLIDAQITDKKEKSQNKYFTKFSGFLSINEAKEAVLIEKGTGSWHQTALLRLHLIEDE